MSNRYGLSTSCPNFLYENDTIGPRVGIISFSYIWVGVTLSSEYMVASCHFLIDVFDVLRDNNCVIWWALGRRPSLQTTGAKRFDTKGMWVVRLLVFCTRTARSNKRNRWGGVFNSKPQ